MAASTLSRNEWRHDELSQKYKRVRVVAVEVA
jgi:hypothetical protein